MRKERVMITSSSVNNDVDVDVILMMSRSDYQQ